MLTNRDDIPLTRRLLGHYVLFGTACVLCPALVLQLGSPGQIVVLAPVAVAALLSLLLVGGVLVRRALRTTAQIESQLRTLASASSTEVSQLQPMPAGGPVAAGWNQLLDQVADADLMSKLDSRLSETLGGAGGHELERILDGLPDGIAVTGRDGRITRVNRPLTALLDTAIDDELCGQSMEELLLVESAANAEEVREKIRETSRPVVFEVQRTSDITSGVIRVARYPLFDEDRELPNHIWSIRDVTQQKLAEEMRSEFLQTATHELRTPLTNIRAYAEMLALDDDVDVEQQKDFCNIINTEAIRLSRFIEEFLDINRMQAGSMALSRHETDIRKLVDEVVEKVRPRLKQKEIEFELVVPPKLPKLEIDKAKVSAALVNLLGNAVQYTPAKGSIQLQVSAGPIEVQFQVVDTGIGIADDELSKVFEKFYRSNDPRVRDAVGSGLGLSFSQEVANLHGGRLTVDSEFNKGTKFTLSLPVT